jgi:hypothetical protein
MTVECRLEIKGHIIDSLTLSKVMDYIIDLGAKCSVEEIKIGENKNSISYARIFVTADSQEILEKVTVNTKKYGTEVI